MGYKKKTNCVSLHPNTPKNTEKKDRIDLTALVNLFNSLELKLNENSELGDDLEQLQEVVALLGSEKLKESKKLTILVNLCLINAIIIDENFISSLQFQKKTQLFESILECIQELCDVPIHEKIMWVFEKLATRDIFAYFIDQDDIHRVFEIFFETLRPDHPSNIVIYILEIMSLILKSCKIYSSIPDGIIRTLLFNLVPSDNRSSVDDSIQDTQEIEEKEKYSKGPSASAQLLSQQIFSKETETLEVSVNDYLSKILVDLENSISEWPNFNDLIYKLFVISPSLVDKSLGLLESSLIKSDSVVRSRTANCLGCIFATPGSFGASNQFYHLFNLFIKRFKDQETSIRIMMIEFAEVYVVNCNDQLGITPVIDALTERVQDSEASVRYSAVHSVMEIAAHEAVDSISYRLWKEIWVRLRDRKEQIRQETIKGLIRCYVRHKNKISSRSQLARENIECIPSQILGVYFFESQLVEKSFFSLLLTNEEYEKYNGNPTNRKYKKIDHLKSEKENSSDQISEALSKKISEQSADINPVVVEFLNLVTKLDENGKKALVRIFQDKISLRVDLQAWAKSHLDHNDDIARRCISIIASKLTPSNHNLTLDRLKQIESQKEDIFFRNILILISPNSTSKEIEQAMRSIDTFNKSKIQNKRNLSSTIQLIIQKINLEILTPRSAKIMIQFLEFFSKSPKLHGNFQNGTADENSMDESSEGEMIDQSQGTSEEKDEYSQTEDEKDIDEDLELETAYKNQKNVKVGSALDTKKNTQRNTRKRKMDFNSSNKKNQNSKKMNSLGNQRKNLESSKVNNKGCKYLAQQNTSSISIPTGINDLIGSNEEKINNLCSLIELFVTGFPQFFSESLDVAISLLDSDNAKIADLGLTILRKIIPLNPRKKNDKLQIILTELGTKGTPKQAKYATQILIQLHELYSVDLKPYVENLMVISMKPVQNMNSTSRFRKVSSKQDEEVEDITCDDLSTAAAFSSLGELINYIDKDKAQKMIQYVLMEYLNESEMAKMLKLPNSASKKYSIKNSKYSHAKSKNSPEGILSPYAAAQAESIYFLKSYYFLKLAMQQTAANNSTIKDHIPKDEIKSNGTKAKKVANGKDSPKITTILGKKSKKTVNKALLTTPKDSFLDSVDLELFSKIMKVFFNIFALKNKNSTKSDNDCNLDSTDDNNNNNNNNNDNNNNSKNENSSYTNSFYDSESELPINYNSKKDSDCFQINYLISVIISCILKLAHFKIVDSQIGVPQFQSMAYLISNCPEIVRNTFRKGLLEGLSSLKKLPLRYLALYPFFPCEKGESKREFEKLIEIRRCWMKENSKILSQNVDIANKILRTILPEYALPWLVSLLAHQPRFPSSEEPHFTLTLGYLNFFIQGVMQKNEHEHYDFMIRLLSDMKQTEDALDPESRNMHMVIELCLLVLQQRVLHSKTSLSNIQPQKNPNPFKIILNPELFKIPISPETGEPMLLPLNARYLPKEFKLPDFSTTSRLPTTPNKKRTRSRIANAKTEEKNEERSREYMNIDTNHDMDISENEKSRDEKDDQKFNKTKTKNYTHKTISNKNQNKNHKINGRCDLSVSLSSSEEDDDILVPPPSKVKVISNTTKMETSKVPLKTNLPAPPKKRFKRQ